MRRCWPAVFLVFFLPACSLGERQDAKVIDKPNSVEDALYSAGFSRLSFNGVEMWDNYGAHIAYVPVTSGIKHGNDQELAVADLVKKLQVKDLEQMLPNRKIVSITAIHSEDTQTTRLVGLLIYYEINK